MSNNNSSNNYDPIIVSIPFNGGYSINLPAPTHSGQTWVFVPNSNGWIIEADEGSGETTVKLVEQEGCNCKQCHEFYEYGKPNQEDGSLICWACRHGY